MTTAPSNMLVPDMGQANRFLTLLDPAAEQFTFQTFDDNQGRKNGSLARIFNGTLEQHAPELTRLNQQGAGVFVTVNETNGRGRKLEDIVRIRSFWQEDDGEGKPLPLEPHIVIESSPGKHHRYLLVDGIALDEFEPIQQRLANDFGSDKAAKDRSRVLRLPGFMHQKAEPHRVRIVQESGAAPYHRDRILSAFPPVTAGAVPDKPDISGETDPVLMALHARGLVIGPKTKEKGAYLITCPWQDEHTVNGGDQETAYWLPHTGGYEGAGFHCFHHHCAHRTMHDLRQWLGIESRTMPFEEEGLPLFTSPNPIGFKQTFLEEPPPPRVLIPGIILCEVFGLVAPGGTSKTTLMLWIMVHVILDLPIFGRDVNGPGPCLFVSAEDDAATVRYRVRKICDALWLSDAQNRRVADNLYVEDVT